MKELKVAATLENTDMVIDFVNENIEDCPTKIQYQIGIAIDEIFSNIARYAYGEETGDAVVRVAVDDNITIEFEDGGKPYNPLTTEDPDITLSAEDRKIGGLGIFMVKNIMDSVEYRHEGNKNILMIKKSLC